VRKSISHLIYYTLLTLEIYFTNFILSSNFQYLSYTSYFIIPVLLSINIIIAYFFFNSFLISLSYAVVYIFLNSVLGIRIDIITAVSLILPTIIFLILLNLIIRKEINDNIINFILKRKIYYKNLKIYLTILIIGSAATIIYYFQFKDLFLFVLFSIIINSIIVALYGKTFHIPLILMPWLSTPYLIDIITSLDIREENGICVGKIRGVLRKGGFSSVIQTQSKYKWKSVSNEEYCFSFSKLKSPHILILGSSGSGKSNLAKLIAGKLDSFIIFDIHGEYFIKDAIRIDLSEHHINPFSLLSSSPKQRALELAFTIKELFNLGNLQMTELYNLFLEAYAEKGIFDEDKNSWNNEIPTFSDVVSLLLRRKSSASSSQELQRYSSIEPYLLFLSNEIFSKTDIELEKIMKGKVILDFSKILIPEIKYLIVETILKTIYSQISTFKMDNNVKKILIIDEAPFILSKKSGSELLEKLVAESRKFGIGFLIISQTTENVKKILANSELIFIFNLIEPNDREYISKLIGGSDSEEFKAIYESLAKLDKGMMIVKDKTLDEILLVYTYRGEDNV